MQGHYESQRSKVKAAQFVIFSIKNTECLKFLRQTRLVFDTINQSEEGNLCAAVLTCHDRVFDGVALIHSKDGDDVDLVRGARREL